MTDPATSFGAAAQQYDDVRPGYPDTVVDWLLDGIDGGVLDVGAGTGKLTTALAARRDEVHAVERDAAMRAIAARRAPSVTVLAGTAESLPLVDGTVSLATFAQSWHWVDVHRAAADLARVLRRPGRLGLVWNYRDDADEWVSRLGEALGGQDSAGKIDDIRTTGPELAAPFGPPERLVVPWQHRVDVQTLVDLAASRSYVIVRPEPERLAVLDAVRGLGEERAGADGRLDLPYMTYAFRSDLGR